MKDVRPITPSIEDIALARGLGVFNAERVPWIDCGRIPAKALRVVIACRCTNRVRPTMIPLQPVHARLPGIVFSPVEQEAAIGQCVECGRVYFAGKLADAKQALNPEPLLV